MLDETGPFATIEAAQASIDEWVHAYNTQRPHQSLDMAVPASLFRARAADTVVPSLPGNAAIDDADALASATPRLQPAPLVRASNAGELDTRVPPSGVVAITGLQQLWVGKHYAGRTVTLWIDLASIHVIIDDSVLKTVTSRLTTTDLERLTMRGVRVPRSASARHLAVHVRSVVFRLVAQQDRAAREGAVLQQSQRDP